MTSVEFLESQYKFNGQLFKSDFQQAKEMEKEQMKALYTMHIVDIRTMELFDFDEYYKQTYESNT